ncbi:MAG: CMP-N,N'-diacetyllegionaminic acid synthase [Bacteroidetes bacterium ADurb.Bin302]|nr:MAG: CMP-N,N'-diacetyllegionaminic acid synthase [Bacteroidetes bacterium ADurb.Bin302]
MKNLLITICARGGSKGIPGKNIKPLNGKPLIGYSIDLAKQVQLKYSNVSIALSTDSEDIINVAKSYGLYTDYKRPDYLSSDTVGKIDAIKDILVYTENKEHIRFEYLLDLDATSPLRNLDDIESAFAVLESDSNAVNLFSVSDASRSPYFNMVEKKENGYFAQVKKIQGDVFTRQSAPKVYDMNASFYIYRRIFFDLGYKGAITDRSLIYKVPHICFDLDHPIDFEIISFLMENNKLDFSL